MRVDRDSPLVVESDVPAGWSEPFPVDLHDFVDAYRRGPVIWDFWALDSVSGIQAVKRSQ
ncbi:hypothetical protein DRB87_14760 [Pandoraea sp. XY-2]|nr:hypothetical protein DRB87_14760 [Pandoraea sp. XY-2]